MTPGRASFYERHFLGLELAVSMIAAAAFAFIYGWSIWSLRAEHLLSGNRSAIYTTLASIFGALLGFVITSLSIVLSYASDPRLAILRESKHYSTLWRIFISSTRWLAVATVSSVAALVFDRDSSPHSWILFATVAVCIVAIARIGRVLWAVENLVWILVKRGEVARDSQRERAADSVQAVD